MTNADQIATERQRKLIDVVRYQLAMSDAERDALIRDVTGDDPANLTRKGASAVITELQRRKNVLIERTKIS